MKRKLLAGISGIMIALLCACGGEKAENSDVTVTVEEIPQTETDTKENPSSAEALSDKGGMPEPDVKPTGQSSVQDDSAAGYRRIYEQTVAEKGGDTLVFSLIYLDGDDIPELVVCDRGYETYSVYTVKNDAVFCMVDSMTTVELGYFERSGIIASFARWNGGGDEGSWTGGNEKSCMDNAMGQKEMIEVLREGKEKAEGEVSGEKTAC